MKKHALTLIAMAMVVTMALETARAQTTIISGTTGGNNSWNDGSNWDAGVPSGAMNALVSAGLTAQVNSGSTPTYSGTLTLTTGSKLYLNNTGGTLNALTSPSGVSLGTNALIRFRSGTFPAPMTLLGPISRFESGSDHQSMTLSGAITGDETFTLYGRNNITFTLSASNDFSGLVADSNNRWRMRGSAAGAFGQGDVVVNASSGSKSATVYIDVADVMSDTATLVLNGTGYGGGGDKLNMSASDSIGALIIDGVPQAHTAYTSAESWLAGAGTLTVKADVVAPYPNPMTFYATPLGATTTSITMTATEGLDYNGPVEYQFTNSTDGTATAWQTGQTWTDTGLTPGVSQTYRVRARDSLGNVGEWSDAGSSPPIVENVMIAASGGDSWNTAGNWTLGHVPTGTETAIVSNNLAAQVGATPPAFTGNLVLRDGASVYYNASTEDIIPPHPAKITLNENAIFNPDKDATFGGPIELLGDAEIGGGNSHHGTRIFNGEISGSGKLTVAGVNNNNFRFASSNSFSGGFATRLHGNAAVRVEAYADGAMGTGDVYLNDRGGLDINAGLSDTIDDTAQLFFVGLPPNKSPYNSNYKLIVDSSETVAQFWIDGVLQPTGTYSKVSGGATYELATINGNGTLHVIGGADVTAPAPDPMTFSSAPYGVTKTAIAMVATLGVDPSGPIEYQFTNETDEVATAWQTDRAYTNTGLTAGQSYSYRVRARDAATNVTDWSGAASSTPIVDNIMTNDASGSDSWNDVSNWSLPRIPTGGDSAVIGANQSAQITSTPSNYTGNLSLLGGAGIVINNPVGTAVFPSPPASMTMSNATSIFFNDGGNVVIDCDILLEGAFSMSTTGGGSGHNESRTLNGSVSGSGSFAYSGGNGNRLYLKAANTFSGGFSISSTGNCDVQADADGAMGTGDVTIGDKSTFKINSGLSDTIDDSAQLFLVGAHSGKYHGTSKFVLDSSETIAQLWIDGVLQSTGTHSRVSGGGAYEHSDWTGNGILDVIGGVDLVAPAPDPMTFSTVPYGVSTTAIAMEATEGVDPSTPVEYQFTNVTDGVATPWQTSRVYTNTGLTPAQSYTYRVRARDAVTNITAWSGSESSTPIVENAMTNNVGGNDSWNEISNWDQARVPTGTDSAVISSNLSAEVDNAATPSYSGNLTLKGGSSLRLRNNAANINVLPTSPASIIFEDGTSLLSSHQTAGGNITFDGPVVLSGDALIYMVDHHNTVTASGGVSGSGQLSLRAANNTTWTFSSANGAWSGGLETHASSSRAQLQATANSGFGSGDVIVNNNVSLKVGSGLSDTISNSADLYLNGSASSTGGWTTKLNLDSDETVDELFIDGIQKAAGVYTSAESWLASGSGKTLTVLTDPPPVPPTIAGSNFVDDVVGVEVYLDHPFFPITYTLTFDLDMDHTTVTAADFENGGTASITIGTITETAAGVFDVDVTPTTAGTIILQIKSGENLESSVGVALDTASAIPDDTTITVNAGGPPTTTISGSSGGNDNWNTAADWDNGVPYGNQNAVVAGGVTANVTGDPAPYTGTLTVNTGSTLYLRNTTGKAALIDSPSSIIFANGSNVRFGDGASYTVTAAISLLGTVNYGPDGGGGSHHDTHNFNGVISGSGGMTLRTANNNTYYFNAANSFSGGITTVPLASSRVRVRATVSGALGAGNVTINDSCSLYVQASDVMSDTATLSLAGAKDSDAAAKVVLSASDTVKILMLDGVLLDKGTYGASGSGADNESADFSGAGILTVLNGPPRTIFMFK